MLTRGRGLRWFEIVLSADTLRSQGSASPAQRSQLRACSNSARLPSPQSAREVAGYPPTASIASTIIARPDVGQPLQGRRVTDLLGVRVLLTALSTWLADSRRHR